MDPNPNSPPPAADAGAEPPTNSGPEPSLSASLSPTHSAQPSRHLASRTVLALGAKASEVTSSMKSSSAVFRYGFETVERLVSPARSLAVAQWNTYGEPLLGRLDNTLDNAINAVASHPTAPSASSADPSSSSASASAPPSAPVSSPDPASELQAAQEREQKTNYLLYWDNLKARLMTTQWFAKVDEILLQNSLVKAVTCKIEGVMRPAEMFFNTATEAFLSDGDSVDSFLDALRSRMGPAWDDRLVGPSRAFYSTAGTVKKLVGAGKFFGGAIQLGKQKLNSAIDGIIAQWDSALSRADDAVDTWLPDRKDLDPALNQPDDTDDGGSGSGRGSVSVSGLPDHRRSDYPAMPFDDEDDDDDSAYDSDYWDEKDRTLRSPGADPISMIAETPQLSSMAAESSYGEEAELVALQLDGTSDADEDFSLTVRSGGHMAGLSESDTLSVASAPVSGGKRHRPKAPLELAEKVTKRLRQRIPLVRDMPAQLKARLVQSQWFQRVDEILRENSIVQMMQLQMMAVSTALDNVVRPAEHFYNTAAQSFRTSSKSYQEFMETLREQMGKAWDERLTKHAFSFFKSASQAAHGNPSAAAAAVAPAAEPSAEQQSIDGASSSI